MLTNEELKKKIAQIIADYFCPQKNEHKNLWGDDRLCYSKTNFAECERVTECTDALIAAGIGDVKDLQVQVDSLEITNIALQAGYDDAENDRLYWVNKYKEAEHRAEKEEKLKNQYCRALLNLARRYVVKTNMTLPHGNEPNSRDVDIEMLALYIMANEREQAEKELAEVNNDNKNQ